MEIQVIRAEIGPETKKYWAEVKAAAAKKAAEVVEEPIEMEYGDFDETDFEIWQKEKYEDEINDGKLGK